jgi:hypothetical protein
MWLDVIFLKNNFNSTVFSLSPHKIWLRKAYDWMKIIWLSHLPPRISLSPHKFQNLVEKSLRLDENYLDISLVIYPNITFYDTKF